MKGAKKTGREVREKVEVGQKVGRQGPDLRLMRQDGQNGHLDRRFGSDRAAGMFVVRVAPRRGGRLEDGAGVSDGIFIWGQCCKGHPDI